MIQLHRSPMRGPVLLAFVLTLVSLSCSGVLSFEGPTMEWEGEVPARLGWIGTGLRIRPGDRLVIAHVSGKWSPWPGGEYDALGFGGDPRCRCNVIMGVSHAALIGRIGANASFLVGLDYDRKVGESGELFLGINDVDLQDNAGALRVRVEVHR